MKTMISSATSDISGILEKLKCSNYKSFGSVLNEDKKYKKNK